MALIPDIIHEMYEGEINDLKKANKELVSIIEELCDIINELREYPDEYIEEVEEQRKQDLWCKNLSKINGFVGYE